MKKVLAIVLVVFLSLTIFVACKPEDNGNAYVVVAPDGAPALAISELMAENMQFEHKFSYSVVPANQIQGHFVGNGEHADFGLLPVNLASKLLGNGDEYKMIGVVTHGNLYFLSKNNVEITAENATTVLKGKSIAVVNLAAVPGLTTKALLNKIGLSYTENLAEKTTENVFLKGVTSTPAAELNAQENPVDYVVAPEPAVTTITTNAPAIKKVGALHDVYGRYPQAVLVVKTEILQSKAYLVKKVFEAIQGADVYVKANTEKVLTTIQNHFPEGTTPSFTNLNNAIVDGCGIDLQTLDEDLLAGVKAYINDIIAVNANSASVCAETFFVNLGKIK